MEVGNVVENVENGDERPRSLRSVNSNSSIASAVSLTRRPRTRARSKTLTAPPSPTGLQLPSSPAVPPRSPQRSLTSENTAKEVFESPTVHLIKPAKSSKAKALPSIVTARTGPSALSRIPSLPALNHTASPNVRDSVLTQDSEISQSASSLYPQSTSGASGTESPTSPASIAGQEDSLDVPVVEELHDYDGDDVSYRLRLLVKNNYFLPPAHSKPSPSDFPSTPMSKKSASPNFLDIFKVGGKSKSKSKPTTPVTPNLPSFYNTEGPPILRTTSDSASGYAQTPLSTGAASPPTFNPQDRSGRVVVVREKMPDIVTAAKLAEQDMKLRGARRDQGSERGPQTSYDDVIDPTDAVDLPPPSSGYPFAVQASALRGLGVQDSVGAAALADRLPPSNSPGVSVYDADDNWRRALLKAAVGHSFDTLHSMPTPPAPDTPSSAAPTSPASTARGIGKSIISSPIVNSETRITPFPRKSSMPGFSRSTRESAPDSRPSSAPSSHVPARADTPAAPLTPLAPPPRKQIINPLYSLSQTDLPGERRSQSSRSGTSSPMLSDAYESDVVRHGLNMTPPPSVSRTQLVQRASSEHPRPSFETTGTRSMLSSGSLYSVDDDDEAIQRPVTSLSQVTTSPTASAFQDALNHRPGCPPSDSDPQSARSSDEARSRSITLSPPPRASSTFGNHNIHPLSPPPRKSSLHYRAAPFTLPVRSSSSSDRNRPNAPTPGEILEPILAPDPVTPPFPLSERRGNPSSTPLTLSIPTQLIPPSIHSAPPPTSFFDDIQSQPNAMDDLDSTDSSDSDDDDRVDDSRGPAPLYVDPRTRTISITRNGDPSSPSSSSSTSRAPIMRLGNHSTPYIARHMEDYRPSLPFGVSDPKQPIGYIPQAPSAFPKTAWGRKVGSDQGHGPPSSTKFDLDTEAAGSRKGLPRPATSGGEGSSSNSAAARLQQQRTHESVKKLDGMLIQHMEAEKNRIRQIATSLRSNAGGVQRS